MGGRLIHGFDLYTGKYGTWVLNNTKVVDYTTEWLQPSLFSI